MEEQSVGNIGACAFCSVKMFGSGAYTDEKTGEIVRFDYVPEEDRDKFCKEHCEHYKPEVEVYLENSSYDKAIKREMLKILKEEYNK